MDNIIEKANLLLKAVANIRQKANKFQISDLNRISELAEGIKTKDPGIKIDLQGISVSNVGDSVLEMRTRDGHKLQDYVDDLVSAVEAFEGYPEK